MKTKLKTPMINFYIIAGGIAAVYILTWIMMRNTWAEPSTLLRWMKEPFYPTRHAPLPLAVVLVFGYLSLVTVGTVFPKTRWLSFIAAGAAMLIWIGAVFVHILGGLIG